MKLEKSVIDYMTNIVNTANAIGIEDVVLDDTSVLGSAPNNVVAIIHKRDTEENPVELPFSKVGLARIPLLVSRLNVLKSVDQFAMDVVVDEEEKFVRMIKLSAKNYASAEYRCANCDTINKSSKVNDVPRFEIKVSSSLLTELNKIMVGWSNKGNRDIVMITGTEDGVYLEKTDSARDKVSFLFDTQARAVNEKDEVENFSFKYLGGVLKDILSVSPNMEVRIGKRGTLFFNINGLNAVMAPIT